MGKLLIIADLKGDGIATLRGLELADKLGLDAEVIAFVHAPLRQLKVDASERAAIKKKLLADREQEVLSRISNSSRKGQRAKLKVVWEKDIAMWINHKCERNIYEMVVKTGRRTQSLSHTSTDWQLLRECSAPVLIVAEKKWARTRPVLASLDLASRAPVKKQLNETILQTARDLATAMGVELEIICAIEVPTLLAELDLIDPRSYVADAKADMEPHIKALAARFDIPEKAFKTKRGPVEKVITSQAASLRAQIVVMGSVGRKGVKAALVGNTAEKVLSHLKTDVLALKP